MRRLEYLAISEISKKGSVVFPEQIEIMKLPVGSQIPVHNDVYDIPCEDGSTTVTPKSEWAGVLYLNQDYNGGKLRFEPCEELPMGFEYDPCAYELVYSKEWISTIPSQKCIEQTDIPFQCGSPQTLRTFDPNILSDNSK